MAVFENFIILKESMQKEGFIIEAFDFNFKEINFVVLVKLYIENENRPQYALLKTEFIKQKNFEDRLIIPVNKSGFMCDPKTLRNFFGIEYSQNIGDILKQFNLYFSQFIPTQINRLKPENLIQPILNSLSKSDKEDPNKIYCYKVRRNSKRGERTIFNDNKTKILRPKLYELFENDKNISFCYLSEISNEKTDKEIVLNFSKNK